MHCKDHPIIEAICSCSTCGTALCVDCLATTAENPLCSRCVAMSAVTDFSEQENEQLRAQETAEHNLEERSKYKVRVQLSIIALSFLMVGFQFYRVFNSERGMSDSEIAAEIAAEDSENACVALFWDIGARLQNNQLPTDSMRCEGMNTSFIVTRDNEDVIVSHPNPLSLGYRSITVRKMDPEPLLVE